MKKYYEPERVKQEVPTEALSDEVRALYLRPGQLIAAQERLPVAYLPMGTLEWHGRHNPLGVDTIKAERLCIETARSIGGVVMPAVPFAADAVLEDQYGKGVGMDAYAGFLLPGSFYQIDFSLLKSWLINACTRYLARGFEMVVMVSGHNPPMQQNLMDDVCYHFKSNEGAEPVVATMEYAVIDKKDPRRHSDHAGGYETSMMLYLEGNRVNLQANEGMERRELSVGSNPRLPLSEASCEAGGERFALQVEGLSRYVLQRIERLREHI